MAKIKLLYVYEERIPQALRALVKRTFPSQEFSLKTMTYTLPDKEKCDLLRWAEVVLFAPGRHLSGEVMKSASHIKLMQLWSSGFDKFNLESANKYNIPVANNGGANAVSVAEHTLLLMLSTYKWLPDSHRRTVEGKWAGNSHGMDMFLLNQKTLGLIGFGNIGRHVARCANGFGMEVLYTDPVPAPSEVESDLKATRCDRRELLERSDFVSLHVHLNEVTRGMIGESELHSMKPNAVLINVSRAQLVDQDALLKALREEWIWGVGLDVYAKEPTEPNDPLLTHPRVIATPHMAGSTFDAYQTALGHCLENFRRVHRGETPKWVVNETNNDRKGGNP